MELLSRNPEIWHIHRSRGFSSGYIHLSLDLHTYWDSAAVIVDMCDA
jgi:hypothetical protein